MDALGGWLGPMNFLQGRIFFSGPPRAPRGQGQRAMSSKFFLFNADAPKCLEGISYMLLRGVGALAPTLKNTQNRALAPEEILLSLSRPFMRWPRAAICVRETKRDLFRE